MTPKEYFRYLVARGLSPIQAQGVLMNVMDESSGNPAAVGDAGQSYGLFQHYGPRRASLFAHAGTNKPTWQQQIDFALTEPDMAKYLEGNYSTPGEAAVAFLDKFERPAKAHRDKRARKYLGDATGSASVGGSTMPVSNNPYGLPPGLGAPVPPVGMPPHLSPQNQGMAGLLNDPLVTIGASILANPSLNPMEQVGKGIMAAQQAGLDQGRLQQYAFQNELARMRAMGQEVPSAYERGNLQRQTYVFKDQTTGETRRLAYDQLRGVYFDPGDPSKAPVDTSGMVPWRESGESQRRASKLYTVTPPGGVPQTFTDAAEAAEAGNQLGVPVYEVGKEGAKRATGESGSEKYAAQMDLLSDLMTDLDQNPDLQKGLGTVGAIGSKLSAAAGIVDTLVGTKFNDRLKSYFGGMDPRVLKGRLQAIVLPVARVMVDEKGPLSRTEQAAARQLVGLLESGDGVLSPPQAYELLKLTHKAMQAATGGGTTETRTTPPTVPSLPVPERPTGVRVIERPGYGRIELTPVD